MAKVHDLFDKLEAEMAPDTAKARVAKGRARSAEDGYTAADIEVPLHQAYPLGGKVLKMLSPGAATSTQSP